MQGPMRTHLDLGPDLNDAAVVGDELLGRNTEGGVADHRLDAAVQPGEDQDSAGTLGSCRVKEVTTFPSLHLLDLLTYHLAQPEHDQSLLLSEGLHTEEDADGESDGEEEVAQGSEKVGEKSGEIFILIKYFKSRQMGTTDLRRQLCFACSYSSRESSMSTKEE